MSQNGDGPDTTSIKPISSLRSKFESLSKDDTPPSSEAGRQHLPLLYAQHSGLRPRTSGGESDAGGMGHGTFDGNQGLHTPLAMSQPRLRRDPTTPRPLSMASMSPPPGRASPPLVTVDSPRSPQKTQSVDLRANFSGQIPSLQPLLSQSGSDAPVVHSRNISRAATPALEARAAAFLMSAEPPTLSPRIDGTDTEMSATNPRLEPTKINAAKVPPVVNRASKPKVPTKPQSHTSQITALAAPEPRGDLTDKSVSPFSTPPSSSSSSPTRRSGALAHVDLPKAKHADVPVRQRPRNESDASWVQRLRGDSDASTIDRARAGSNASFVEPSSLPDSWQIPPLHHAIATQREAPFNALKKAPTMPTHYKSMSGREASVTEDSPEERPRLPARPELQMRPRRTSPPKSRSGRTSPLKTSHILPLRRSADVLRNDALFDLEPPQIPVGKSASKSARSRDVEETSEYLASPIAPALPPSRRSVDRRRNPPLPPTPASASQPARITPSNGHSRDDAEDPAPYGLNDENTVGPTDYPDATKTIRRPPKFKQRPWLLPTDYDTRLFAVCGDYVCTTGYITKAWNLRTGKELVHIAHRENSKVTSIVFKPSPNIEDEGKRVWLGTNIGEIHEIDIVSQSLIKTRTDAHKRREVLRMFRYASELWTLDDGGELYVWKPDHKGMPSLDSQYTQWRVPKGHSYSIACGKQLWIASGKGIRVFYPSARSDSEFQAVKATLSQPGTGDITSGATIDGKPDLIYFGHSDGKVTIYNRNDFSCRAVVNVSVYKIVCLAGVGDYLWAGYSTGMAYVYDTSTDPWLVKKDWKAHEKQICGIIADPSAMWKMGRLNVVTLGLDNVLRVWDGMLKTDWLEAQMHNNDSEYCSFEEVTVAVMTWNAGAAKPSWLLPHKEDSTFFRDFLVARQPPDVLVFGFQELVDLEDKRMTAKSLFKSKRKDPAEQEHMSRQYRAWRDHLTKCIDDHMPNEQTYTLLHTTSMVGLFTCIFVKSHLRQRIRHVHTSEVKRGMGGHHGNKGALIVRMVLDDSSICFVNCHLAAGQTQTLHRNNDVAEILEASTLPPYPLNGEDSDEHSDIFAAGGDGSMIMDHEICILNGDLNYRIDTMGRDAVVKQVTLGNITKLLERDQLLLSRKKNPGFRLRAFYESPITFAPTYKYNVGTDEYDTSEKRRAPAWCDRILYRGLGKVKMDEYRRWDQIRVSDHRPVSGRLRLRVKTVNPEKRAMVWNQCIREFEGVGQRIARAAQLEYLCNVLGMSQREAIAALQGA